MTRSRSSQATGARGRFALGSRTLAAYDALFREAARTAGRRLDLRAAAASAWSTVHETIGTVRARRLGRRWYIDELFLFFHGAVKRYLYRAVDEHGQVVDVLLRERRDLASAQAFFAAPGRSPRPSRWPSLPITISPYVKAGQQNLPGSLHIRTGLHRLTGETTKPIERSHIATRDRLRASRGS